MLRIVNLKKTFPVDKGRVAALKGVSLEVAGGDFFTLLGPSGSGKSTVMRCVAGLEHPDDGEIFIDGKCVFSAARHIAAPPEDRPIGMVFQSYAIWPHMDVFHNVAFPLMYGSSGKRMSRADVKQAVGEALSLVQMTGYEDRPATQLSGGQQQRVALARAIVRKPKLLLLDEPLSNLDAQLREEMRVELRELTRSLGITSFFVTHDQVEALAMSDKIAVIMAGELVETGAPHDVYVQSRNRKVATFLGVTNTLEGEVRNGAVQTTLGLLSVIGGTADGRAAIAIRPEAVRCSRERPSSGDNIFEGVINRVTFLGTFIDGEIQVGGHALRVSLSPYDAFAAGERVYIHIPAERLQLVG